MSHITKSILLAALSFALLTLSVFSTAKASTPALVATLTFQCADRTDCQAILNATSAIVRNQNGVVVSAIYKNKGAK